MNKGVIKLMKVGFESYLQIRRKNRAVGTTSEEIDAEETAFKEFTISLNRHLARATQHQKRVLFLVKRCDGLIALVSLVNAFGYIVHEFINVMRYRSPTYWLHEIT
jgi:hypothetical protein